jgi:DNA-binding YbaB/EbfC family protein
VTDHADDDHDDAAEGALALPDLSDLSSLGSLDGGALGGLLEQAQQMMAAQADAAARQVEGVAGGGMVRIQATGPGQVLGVTIAPEVVDPDDVTMLEDLVLAALHDVNAQLAEIQREAMGPLGDLFGGG